MTNTPQVRMKTPDTTEARLDAFLSEFELDEQERILRYALDHIVPRLKSLATHPAHPQVAAVVPKGQAGKSQAETVLAILTLFRESDPGEQRTEALKRILSAFAPTPQAREPAEPAAQFEKVRSIIHGCPAVKLPQSLTERLGGVAQIVALKGADDAIADELIARLNAASSQAEPAQPQGAGDEH